MAAQLDRTVAAVQELQTLVSGKAAADFDAQVLTSFDGFRLAGRTARASKFLKFDAQGDPDFDNTLTDDMLAELAALDALGAGVVKKLSNGPVPLYAALDSSAQGELLLNVESAEGIKATALDGAGVSLLDVGALGVFLLAAEDAAAAQELLDLVPGTDVQPYDADLAALAALASTGTVQRTGAGAFSTYTVSDFAKSILDDANASAARDTLELGTLAVEDAASVGVDIVPDSDITRDLGSADNQWAEVHALSYLGQDANLSGTIQVPLIATDFLNVNNGGALVLGTGVAITSDGDTADSNKTSLEFTDPTGTRVIVFPDASGTVALTSDISGSAVTLSSALDSNLLGITDQQLTLDNQSANRIFAGPGTGSAAAPAFRALVEEDINGLSPSFATVSVSGTLQMEDAEIVFNFVGPEYQTGLYATEPTDYRALYLPDASGTLLVNGATSASFGEANIQGNVIAGDVIVGTSNAETGAVSFLNESTSYGATLRASSIASSGKVHELPNVSGTLPVFGALPVGSNYVVVSNGTAGDLIGSATLQISSTVAASVPFAAPNGSASAPSITFASDPDCGLYRSGTNQIALAANGANKLIIDNGYVASQVQFFTAAGSASLPGYTFNGDSNSGIYSVGPDQVGFATNGTLRMRLDDNGLWFFKQLYAASGSASFPGQSFADDTDTGWYRVGADQIGGTCGGTQRFLLTSTGVNNTAIGQTTRAAGSFTTIRGRRPLTQITGSGTLPSGDGTVYRVTSAAAPLSLPTSPSDGDVVTIVVSHASPSSTQIFPDAGVLIISDFGTADGDTPAWIYTSTQGGSITLVYDSSDGAWVVIEKVGTWAIDA